MGVGVATLAAAENVLRSNAWDACASSGNRHLHCQRIGGQLVAESSGQKANCSTKCRAVVEMASCSPGFPVSHR